MRPLPKFAFSLLFFFGAVFASDESVEKRVKCPDGESFCPEGTTCCQLNDLGHYEWAGKNSLSNCCPLPDAVCCSDHLHCCPESTQCDLEHQTCLEGDRSHPLYRKFPASTQSGRLIEEREREDQDVICPDKTSKCPPFTTCCPLSGGGRARREFWRHSSDETQSVVYGCCPAEQAVCCADHIHCCPHGTQCDTEEGKCTSGGQSRQRASSSPTSSSDESAETNHPPMRKVPATKLAQRKPAQKTEPAVHLCGNIAISKGAKMRVSTCARDEKCCRYRNAVGEKATGCCPFPDGQCCAHSGHCCPSGFACDRDQGRCVSEQNGITLSTKMFSLGNAHQNRLYGSAKPTECPDGTFCSSNTDVCCPRTVMTGAGDESRTEYDCCPLSKGICCAGQRRECCAMGYKCNGDGECERMSVRKQIVNLLLDRD